MDIPRTVLGYPPVVSIYLAYQGPAEGAYLAAYNHTSKVWKGPVKVLDNPMGGVNPELVRTYAQY